jgi:UDP-2,3-diacylglucosamine hydrolase
MQAAPQLAGTVGAGLSWAVPAHTLVVLADAHLGATAPDVQERLLGFLARVPEEGDALLINGDLFDFWFSYGRVIPRSGFRVAAALERLAARLPVVMVGGNHDRWDTDFWRTEVGVDFHPAGARLLVGRRRIFAVHGDGLTDRRWSSRLVHWTVSHPATRLAYRAVHPDLGLPLVDRLAPILGDRHAGEEQLARAAASQRAWAADLLARATDVDLLVMGHTHRPALEELAPGRHYLNPGAWFDEGRYAVVTEADVRLCRAATPRT